jgi:replicative DNA helicase
MTVHKLHAGELASRRPPHNIEAEQALLGAVLIKNAAYEAVSDFLRPTDFHDPLHQRVYELVSKQVAAGRPVDVVTIKHEVENLEPVNKMTVPQYLSWLVGRATTTVNAREYGRTIRELSDRRQLITIGEDIANAAFDSPIDFPVAEQITEAEARLYSLAQSDKYGQGFENFDGVSAAAMEMAVNARESGGASGLSTGFVTIDNKLGGFQSTDLIVAAGRPSMGKTSLATNIAFNVAKAGGVVGFFSLEMSPKQLATRILSEQAHVPLREDPPSPDHRRRDRPTRQSAGRVGVDPAQDRWDRCDIDCPACRPRAASQAPAEAPRSRRRRLSAADDRQQA